MSMTKPKIALLIEDSRTISKAVYPQLRMTVS